MKPIRTYIYIEADTASERVCRVVNTQAAKIVDDGGEVVSIHYQMSQQTDEAPHGTEYAEIVHGVCLVYRATEEVR